MEKSEILKRISVLIITVVIILGSISVLSFLVNSTSGAENISTDDRPEYNVSSLTPNKIPAEGQIDTSPNATGSKTILLDRAHGNKFQKENIQPLISSLIQQGHKVEIVKNGEIFERALKRADAFIVIDPTVEYKESDVRKVDEFVKDGGKLLMIGEPNRKSIIIELLSVEINTLRSEITTLSSNFGMSFGTSFLYNIQRKDGNYRNIIVSPTKESNFKDINITTMYTATDVQTDMGEPILKATQETQKYNIDGKRRYTVAAVDGNILAIGDKSMFSDSKYNIADNEKFISRVVEFLVIDDENLLNQNVTPADLNKTKKDIKKDLFNNSG